MQIAYTCPYWGQEGTKAALFLARVLEEEYDGVEINLPESLGFVEEFQATVANIRSVKKDFKFIAQQVLAPAREPVAEYLARMKSRLEFLVSLKPDFINSHTGKDYFSFGDNCRIIEAAENISARSGIPVLHETHRGRFTFHAASLQPYLNKFPELKLTGDFSHWCTVSESMLEDQQAIVDEIIPHIHHIHARIGYEHSPQVNDPFAPEWGRHTEIFTCWWKKIIAAQSAKGARYFTITPEFGPVPYMPTLPYSQKPLADQWLVNTQLKNALRRKFSRKLLDTTITL
jgi:sugar phosphate isomerase/epimerase